MDASARSVCYEIRVRGLLGETLLGAFPGLRAQADGTETVLTGPLPDQAALHGVLTQIGSASSCSNSAARTAEPPQHPLVLQISAHRQITRRNRRKPAASRRR
jgi:hypothetical protein